MHYDVFISYSRKDYVDEKENVIPNNAVSVIKETLKREGITYWFDEEGIYVGETFADKIVNSIDQADILIFISSENSNKSLYTPKEIAYAAQQRKYIIPVLIDQSKYSTKVNFWLADVSYLVFYSNPQKGLNDLVESIKSHLRTKENDEKLIAELKVKCQKLNQEESNIEQQRDKLLSASKAIKDKIERVKIQSVIKDSSPIRAKHLNEINGLKEEDDPTIYDRIADVIKKISKLVGHIGFNTKSILKNAKSSIQHFISLLQSGIAKGMKGAQNTLNNIGKYLGNCLSAFKQREKGTYLRSLIWIIVALFIVSASYYGWQHRSVIRNIVSSTQKSDTDTTTFETASYIPNLDPLMDTVHSIITNMDDVDTSLLKYYNGFLKNDLYSTYALGKKLEKDRYVGMTPSIAAQLVERAARSGYADAQTTLGFYYYFGKQGHRVDYDSSTYWFNEAINNGSNYAKYYMGHAYMHGGYPGKNKDKARYFKADSLLTESGNAGYARSLYELALYYQYNKRDYEKAFMYYNSAYQSHESASDTTKELKGSEIGDCAYQIGDFYRRGLGTEKEPNEANKWIKIAAEAGNKKAIQELSKK